MLKRRSLIKLIILLCVVGGGVYGFIQWRSAQAKAQPHAEVRTGVAEMGEVLSTVTANGTLQAFTTVDVKSKAGGTVVKMAVEEGTRVKAGQLICIIDPVDEQAAYDQTMADVSTAEAALRQARDSLQFQQTTVGPQIGQAQAAVASASSKLKQSQDALALQRQNSENAVQQAKEGLTAAQARLIQAQQQSSTQPTLTNAAIDQAKAGVDAAQSTVEAEQEVLNQLTRATQPQERASAEAQVSQANSEVKTNQLNLQRQQSLLAKGFVAQTVVDAAQNQLIASQSAAQTAQAKLDTLKQEQLAAVRQQEARIQQSRGQVTQSQAGLANARANSVQDVLKVQDLKAAQATARQAQVALNDAIANRKQITLKQSDVQSALAALRQSQAGLQTTQANTIQNKVKAEDVQQDIARLNKAEVTARNARVNLGQTTVVASSAGVVLKKYVDVGTIIQSGLSGFSAGTAIVQLADESQIYVDTQVDEADIAAVQPNETVKITLDAYPDRPLGGTVRKLFPTAQVDSNVTYVHVQVLVNPAEVDERLRPSMNATCIFTTGDKKDVLEVPTDAVKEGARGTTVTVIKDVTKPFWLDSNQERRTVQVGAHGDETTEITSGLKAGDTVVTQIIPAAGATGNRAGGAGGAPRGPTGGMGGGGGGGGRRG